MKNLFIPAILVAWVTGIAWFAGTIFSSTYVPATEGESNLYLIYTTYNHTYLGESHEDIWFAVGPNGAKEIAKDSIHSIKKIYFKTDD